MKTISLLLSMVLFSIAASAQYCGSSGSFACIPDSSLPAPGISDYHLMPCVERGMAFSGTMQLYFPATYNTLHIDSVHIDSVTNLPCGLCWSSSKASNMFMVEREDV